MNVTIRDLLKKKKKGEKISMITAYDAVFARLVDMSEIDMILVGDSLGMVIQGRENTLPVTLNEMIYHTEIVVRTAPRPFVVSDLPFMSYHLSPMQAVENSGRVIKESNAQGIKLEGGLEFVDTIQAITRASIPVMGHLGLTPQSIHQMGGFKVQGKTKADQSYLIESAIALQEAGAFSIVLEAIPFDLAQRITEAITIPTIGIGAGPYTDGQVLVLYDLLGCNSSFKPKFVKQYLKLEQDILGAFNTFHQEVKDVAFPTMEHSFQGKKKSSDTVKLYSE